MTLIVFYIAMPTSCPIFLQCSVSRNKKNIFYCYIVSTKDKIEGQRNSHHDFFVQVDAEISFSVYIKGLTIWISIQKVVLICSKMNFFLYSSYIMKCISYLSKWDTQREPKIQWGRSSWIVLPFTRFTQLLIVIRLIKPTTHAHTLGWSRKWLFLLTRNS